MSEAAAPPQRQVVRPAPRLRALGQAAVVVAVVAGGLAVAPAFYPNQLLLFNLATFLTLALGVNVMYGFVGYLPFGYAGFFGAGAYGFAVLVMQLGLHPIAAILGGGAVTIAIAAILTPLLRLSGPYFAIASLAAAVALHQVVANPALEGITKGPYGVSLSGIFAPRLSYDVLLVILAGTLALVVWLRHSRFGLALQAIREDAVSAEMAGVPVVRLRILAWLASALVAGLAGGAYAWQVSVFYPETVFGIDFAIFPIVFALFGGIGTVTGPILGTLALYGLYNAIGLSAPQYFQLVFGLVIVVLVLFLPNGLVSLLARWGLRVP